MNASDYLKNGVGVLEARAAEYDKPGGERSADTAAAMWSILTGRPMSAADGWLFLACLKAVRLHSAPGPHDDSAMDGAVYFALAGEARHKEPKPPAGETVQGAENTAIARAVSGLRYAADALRQPRSRLRFWQGVASACKLKVSKQAVEIGGLAASPAQDEPAGEVQRPRESADAGPCPEGWEPGLDGFYYKRGALKEADRVYGNDGAPWGYISPTVLHHDAPYKWTGPGGVIWEASRLKAMPRPARNCPRVQGRVGVQAEVVVQPTFGRDGFSVAFDTPNGRMTAKAGGTVGVMLTGAGSVEMKVTGVAFRDGVNVIPPEEAGANPPLLTPAAPLRKSDPGPALDLEALAAFVDRWRDTPAGKVMESLAAWLVTYQELAARLARACTNTPVERAAVLPHERGYGQGGPRLERWLTAAGATSDSWLRRAGVWGKEKHGSQPAQAGGIMSPNQLKDARGTPSQAHGESGGKEPTAPPREGPGGGQGSLDGGHC